MYTCLPDAGFDIVSYPAGYAARKFPLVAQFTRLRRAKIPEYLNPKARRFIRRVNVSVFCLFSASGGPPTTKLSSASKFSSFLAFFYQFRDKLQEHLSAFAHLISSTALNKTGNYDIIIK
jgi:hypothetical protein